MNSNNLDAAGRPGQAKATSNPLSNSVNLQQNNFNAPSGLRLGGQVAAQDIKAADFDSPEKTLALSRGKTDVEKSSSGLVAAGDLSNERRRRTEILTQDSLPAEILRLDERDDNIFSEQNVEPQTPSQHNAGYTSSDVNQNPRYDEAPPLGLNQHLNIPPALESTGRNAKRDQARPSNPPDNNLNLFRRSHNNDDQSSVTVSRASFPNVQLGLLDGNRQNHVVQPRNALNAPESSQPNPQLRHTNQAASNVRPQNQNQAQQNELSRLNLNEISSEQLNKILYNLLQQKELVKYILQSVTNNAWNSHNQNIEYLKKHEEAGNKLVDSIQKQANQILTAVQDSGTRLNARTTNQNMNRTQIHSIASTEVKEIFVMLNNFAIIFMKLQDLNKANVLMQCAIQINKYYQDIQASSKFSSLLYNNLSMYHLYQSKAKQSKQDEKRSSMYMDGAIIANKRTQAQAEQQPLQPRAQISGDSQVVTQGGDNMTKFRHEISLAISFNNKAVIELRRNNIAASREFSLKTIEMTEHRVHGWINSGLANQINRNQTTEQQISNQSSTQSIFLEILQVLLIGYFNLAMTQDRELATREIYLKGMQLSYQYLPGGHGNILFKKFEQKYSRKVYQFMEQQQQPEQNLVQDLDPQQPLPEILPINNLQDPSSYSQSNASPHFFNQNIQLNLNPALRQANRGGNGQPYADMASLNLLDSSRTGRTQQQQQVILRHQDSRHSMLTVLPGDSNTNAGARRRPGNKGVDQLPLPQGSINHNNIA